MCEFANGMCNLFLFLMNICIIGLGLLGGSTALGLKAGNRRFRIVGVETNREHAAQALSFGIVNKILPLEEGIEQSDVIVVATPVNVILELLPQVLDVISEKKIVIDLGSTKELICRQVHHHPNRGRFVAGHPIAGTEHSGPQAAFAKLLPGKQMILCEREKSDIDALDMVENLFRRKLKMRVSYMNASDHDRHIAYVSHLSHISSFALSNTVLEKEKDERSIFEMAGSGFSSTVRLAKSSPDMWVPIFTQNTQNISKALEAYIKNLQHFKEILDTQNEKGSYEWMEKANDIRRILQGIEK